MVKTIISIFITVVLLFGVSIFESFYVENTFEEFSAQLETLYDKTEEQTATRNDALAVRASWDEKKKTLHIWIPHNDISYIDYWLNEGLSLIDTGNFEHALSKLEVLIEICKNIPSAYAFSLENIL